MEKVEDEPIICIREVNENLRRVELGMELTRPLRQLNRNCKFKEEYREWCNRRYGKTEEEKARQREYNQKPEVKARQRAYNQKPEVKAKKREYLRKKLNIKPENFKVK